MKFFLWQMFHNKLQVAGTLVKRGRKGSTDCCLCDLVETVNHVFFRCHLSSFAWGILQEIFGLSSCPRSLEELSTSWLQGRGPLPKRLTLFIFAGFAWALWITRNKMAIEKSFVKSPSDLIYMSISFLQRRSMLLKEKDKVRVIQVLESIRQWMKNFKPNSTSATDVYEI